MPEPISTRQQARKGARKVRVWTKEEAMTVQHDLTTLNESGKVVTAFFLDLFHGNFFAVFELCTTPLDMKPKGVSLNGWKSLHSKNQNLMDMIALKRALEQMAKKIRKNTCVRV